MVQFEVGTVEKDYYLLIATRIYCVNCQDASDCGSVSPEFELAFQNEVEITKTSHHQSGKISQKFGRNGYSGC